MKIKTREEAAALLERRLQESGLSTERFAVEVMVRQARTVRRWLDRSSPIPNVVLDKLEEPKVAPWPAPEFEDIPEDVRRKFAEDIGEDLAIALTAEDRPLRLAALRVVNATSCADPDCCPGAVEVEAARLQLFEALQVGEPLHRCPFQPKQASPHDADQDHS